MKTSIRSLVVAGLCSSVYAELIIEVHRPSASLWKRTQCGGPSGPADVPSRWADDVKPTETPLNVYPRPQMVRQGAGSQHETSLERLRDEGDSATWFNLNGMWEWEPATVNGMWEYEPAWQEPPFGKTLSSQILVPYPVESCLSGVAPKSVAEHVQSMWYRLTFNHATGKDGRTLIHFGAVDWQATVYLNTVNLGSHVGGYDGFSFDITNHLKESNELLVNVFDPSDYGAQPNGKQRISAIDNPSGDTYTPSSGIWQTVWLENVPKDSYIRRLDINQASLSTLTVSADIVDPGSNSLTFTVMDGDREVTSVTSEQTTVEIQIPGAKLWTPDEPNLYDLKVTYGSDTVISYFGLRTFTVGKTPGNNVTRPLLNGKFTFLAGFLDQSFWPDGQYTAPTDKALESDLLATKMFGFNMIRLHQKVNPERWYYYADRHGLVIFQDMIQKYTEATSATVPLFVEDLTAMVLGRGNHPCIVQWTAFNEEDCWGVFTEPPYDVTGIVRLLKKLDPTRLVDTDSGGGADNLHVGDVHDVHTYPNPGDPIPRGNQYAMIGEFGGIGAFIPEKEWVPNKWYAFLGVNTAADQANKYIEFAKTILKAVDHVSASVYTQTTDLETECDGFLNYDRSNKFTDEQTKAIHDANRAIIEVSKQLGLPQEMRI
jgi:hypothetical protein